MQFTCNTKPLADALSLGIINSNVSKYYRKSCLAQLSATKTALKINLEAESIVTELIVKGASDTDAIPSIFVDSLVLKQLVSTFDTATVTLEFQENGLVLHAGKSKFTLPKMIDSVELELNAPKDVSSADGVAVDIKKDTWKFVKDHQMFAIAMSFVHPVYTKVWIGDAGDIIVGDFDNSLFTHSTKGNLGSTCLLSETIINLFNALPEGAKLFKYDRTYVIRVDLDSYTYVSEFTPQYEDDEGVGSYNSTIFLDMMKHPDNNAVQVSAAAMNKFLGQASLLSTNTEDTIFVDIGDGQLRLYKNDLSCQLDAKGITADTYKAEFKVDTLKSVVSNYADADTVFIAPMIQENETIGFLFWNADVTTLLAVVE